MGEAQAAGPNLEFDYAQNPLGDKDLSLSAGTGAAVTWDVAGCVAAPDDDGALQFNYNQSGNDGAPDGSSFSATDVTNTRWAFAGTDAFSVECLFNPTAGWNSNGNHHGLVSTHNIVGGSLGGWFLGVIRTGGNIVPSFVRAANPGSLTSIQSAVAADSSVCHHFAATYDGTTMRLYQDGVLVASSASAVSVASRQSIDIGKTTINEASDWQRYVYGILDEVAVYSAVLTDDEILEHATCAGTTSAGTLSPAARVYRTTNQTITNGVTTSISFDAERYDTNGMHDNSTNPERITIQTAGKYAFKGNVSFASNATGIRDILILLNGTTTIAQILLTPVNGFVTIIDISCDYECAAGDYVELQVFHNITGGGTLAVTAAGNYSPEFSAFRFSA